MPYCFKKLFLLAALMFVCGFSVWAQRVEVNTPDVVAVGEAFRIEFSVNAKPQDFTAPAFAGFDVIAGPSTAVSNHVSIVNGNIEKTESYSYTYVLMANAAGRFNVSPAEVNIDGKKYTSRATVIEVAEADAMPGNSQGTPAGTAASIAEDDILIRVLVNRNNVYKGQPVKATFKLYTRLPIRNVTNVKYPALNGFWAQDLNAGNEEPRRETYNNKVYETFILKETLLFPQQAGNLYVEQCSLTANVQIAVQNASSGQSAFDIFFGGGQSYSNINKTVSSTPVLITVKDFPGLTPNDFTGAVGDFKMTGGVEKTDIAANSSDVYTITISGAGNLALVQAPKVDMPTSFEQYNVKTTESLSNSANGISGYRTFEYPFIARAEGEYTINPVEFTYFDPQKERFITLSTEPQSLNVNPDSTAIAAGGRGIVSGISKEDVKILDRDIRFIRTGEPRLHKKGNLFFGSFVYFGILALLLAAFAVAYRLLKKHFENLSNKTLIRNRKANKVAFSRLRLAKDHMQADSKDRFYEEMLKALWGYMSDKLNIPVSNLTKDNIREELARRNISQECINRFIDIISDCEYAQYSPSATGHMMEVYNSAVTTLSKFESLIKK